MMSVGVVICSECHREVHQRQDMTWYHCEDKSTICTGAKAIYPKDDTEIIGAWCGCDAYDEPWVKKAQPPKVPKHLKKKKYRRHKRI